MGFDNHTDVILKNLINNLPYCVFWKDRQCVYRGCNQKFADAAGLKSPDEIIGKTDHMLAWTKEEADWYLACDEQVMSNDEPELDIEETQLRADGMRTVLRTSKIPLHDENGKVNGILGFYLDITVAKDREEQLYLQTNVLKNIANCVVITSLDGTIRWVNPALCNTTGYSYDELVGAKPSILKSGKHSDSFYKELWETLEAGHIWHGEMINQKKDGSFYTIEMTITPVKDEAGVIEFYIGIQMDISEKKELEFRLAQAHRLESVGQLAAGIAHEINSPAQFIGDNIRFLQSSFDDVFEVMKRYRNLSQVTEKEAEQSSVFTAITDLSKTLEEHDADYLMEEIPRAIEQSLDGINRISSIVHSMKAFSHPGGRTPEPADISTVIENTVAVAQNEWKYVAEVDVEVANDRVLKNFPCFQSDLSQAILIILVNAAHAIKERQETSADKSTGRIAITAKRYKEGIEIRISDNGTGIAPDNISKIFDPFYTTKSVGQGSGQGLNIAYQAIVSKHSGVLYCESEVDQGATFIIRLPLADDDRGFSK